MLSPEIPIDLIDLADATSCSSVAAHDKGPELAVSSHPHVSVRRGQTIMGCVNDLGHAENMILS